MLKWICALALAAVAVSPALAQKPKDSPPKMTTSPDIAIVREGALAVKQNGECTVTFVVGEDGKTADHKADCTVAEFAPFAIRAMQSSVWEPEILDGEKITSYPRKQAFKFGSGAGTDPRGEKAPVVVKNIGPKEVERVISRLETKVEDLGACNVTYTVGADGKPKDVKPNCTTQGLNAGIAEAVGKMEYQPGLKGGQPVDWPGMQMPMNLSKPKE
jgi:hypothetical protein